MSGSMIELNPEWRFFARNLKNPEKAMRGVQENVAKWAMTQGVKTAQAQLDRTVYNVSAPGKEGAGHYGRTGKTRRAVRKDGVSYDVTTHGVVGSIRLDHNIANRDGFYYPRILEEGMRKHPAYYARQFWMMTRIVMGVLFRNQGQRGLGEIKRLFTVH